MERFVPFLFGALYLAGFGLLGFGAWGAWRSTRASWWPTVPAKISQLEFHNASDSDGEAYEGCQAACMIFWKEAWLKPVSQDARVAGEPKPALAGRSQGCTEADVLKGTRAADQPPGSKVKYICQATELLNYTQPLKWWDARQYVEA